MWVRFLTSNTGGSLMTYGNPLLKTLPGFRLDTLVRSDGDVNRRTVRLVVWENTLNSDGALYDSHVAHFNRDKQNTVELGKVHYGTEQQVADGIAFSNSLAGFRDSHSTGLISTNNLNEWFFICATYDPLVDEEGSFGSDIFDGYITDKDYWMNKKETDGDVVASSGFGNRCKVEVISRSDLLTARGFKV